MNHLFRILLDSTGVEGGGSSSVPDLAKSIEGLLNKHGDPNAALRVLLSENYELRDKIRTISGKVPAEGSVVLSGDDADRWKKYRELGEPSEFRKAVSERDQFRNDAERLGRVASYDEVASESGLNPKAFRRLAEAEKLVLETKEVRADDGKLIPTVHVKGVDAEGKEKLTPLSEYIDRSWAEFKPALYGEGSKVEPQARPGSTPVRRDPNPHPPAGGGDQQINIKRPVGPVVKAM